MEKILFVTAICCMCMIYACNSSKEVSKSKNLKKYNQAYLYAESPTIPNIHLKIHHTSKDSADIYLGFPVDKLQLDSLQNAHLKVTYELYKDLNAKNILYSLIANFEVKKSQQLSTFATLKNRIAVADGQDYLLKIIVSDAVAFKNYYLEEVVRKGSTFNEQSFLATNAYNKQVLFDNYSQQNSRIRVQYRNEPLTTLQVKYHPPFRELALPTFKTERKRPYIYAMDSTFTTDGSFTLSKIGTYSVQVKEAEGVGLILVGVDNRFPKLADAKDLVEALRYITRSEEFEKMIRADDSRAAVDSFWLDRAGSFDRGKVLVKEFYGRVQRANDFFTTYKEGWKTDRGVVLVIYGEPDVVYKESQSEQWIYESTSSQDRISFTFEDMPHAFARTEPQLVRSSYYEDSWHRAVYEWRKGLIGKTSKSK
ncbi:MAG: GWxTD domain-containing protein [Chitinophagales bacterium]